MKIVLILAAFCAVSTAELDPRCAYGQSFWCQSLESSKLCGAYEHCKTTAWKNQVLKEDASDACTFCKSIINDVKKFLDSGKTKDEIGKFLSSACGIIPDQSISDKCKHVVEFLITEIIELIEAGADPQTVCSLMGVCSGLEDSVSHPIVTKPTEPKPAVTPVNQEPICTDCKKFFGDIRDMITSNKTRHEIEQLIDQNVCSMLGSLRNQCKVLVHEFLPDLLKYMASYYDPNLICQSLGVCSGDQKFYAKNFELFVRLRQLPPYKIPAGENSAGQCLMCKAVLTQLQTLIRDKSVQDAVKNFAKMNFCSHTGTMRELCEKTVDSYSTELFELLVNLLEPSVRCKALGLCDASNDGSRGPVQTMAMLPLTPAHYPSDKKSTELESGPQCALCKLVMKQIVTLIGSNATEQNIVHALEKVCHMMPDQIVASCVDFVDTYGPAVIELIVQELDPDLICSLIKLCDKKTDVAATVPAMKATVPVKLMNTMPLVPAGAGTPSNEMCSVCEMMIEYLERMLKDNSSVAEIQAMLSRICYHLPAKYVDKCQNLVKEYTDLIIFYIEALASPKQICTLIGVCDGQTVEAPEVKKSVPVTGQNECTWGVKFWCNSMENAQKCNAVNYCKRFVWTGGAP